MNSIHHINLPAKDVRRSARFYAEIIGFAEQSWVFPPAEQTGSISADPSKLTLFPLASAASGDNAGLHLIKPDPDFAAANNLLHNPSIGGHPAFQVPDLDAIVDRLKRAGIPYSLTDTFAIPNMRHLYVYDPDMNLLELNEIKIQ